MVMTARHLLVSTLFFCASSWPARVASAEPRICGSVKHVVVLVLMPLEARIFSTSMPSMLAGTLIITFGLSARSSSASFTI